MIRTKIYTGQDKALYQSGQGLILEFFDKLPHNCGISLEGKAETLLPGKASINNRLSAFIMEKLSSMGISNHFIKLISLREQLVEPCDMFIFSAVMRNYARGSLVKRLGLGVNTKLEESIIEFFIKSKDLNYPLVNNDHLIKLGFASKEDIEEINKILERVNDFLSGMFITQGLILVDFCLEFGRSYNEEEDVFSEILICDEISLDSMTLYNPKTQEYFGRQEFMVDINKNFDNYCNLAKNLGIITQVFNAEEEENMQLDENKEENREDGKNKTLNKIRYLYKKN